MTSRNNSLHEEKTGLGDIDLCSHFFCSKRGRDYARIILLVSVGQLMYVGLETTQMSFYSVIYVAYLFPLMLWVAPSWNGKWVINVIFWLGLALSIIALLQPPIHDVHRWATVFGIRGHAALLLGASSVLWFSVRPHSIVRLVLLCGAVIFLIATRSYTLSLVVIVSAFCIILVARAWHSLFVLITLLLIGAMIPFALSANRLVRFIEFMQGESLPFQTAQARNCIRSVVGLGTSAGYRATLPGWRDDLSFVDILRQGGAVAGVWVLWWHGVVAWVLWGSRNWVDERRNYIGIGGWVYYIVILFFHLLSNATLIPTIGVSAPFQGGGLSNLLVGCGIVSASFLKWDTDDSSGERTVSSHWLWYCWLLGWLGSIAIVLSLPFWASNVISLAFS